MLAGKRARVVGSVHDDGRAAFLAANLRDLPANLLVRNRVLRLTRLTRYLHEFRLALSGGRSLAPTLQFYAKSSVVSANSPAPARSHPCRKKSPRRRTFRRSSGRSSHVRLKDPAFVPWRGRRRRAPGRHRAAGTSSHLGRSRARMSDKGLQHPPSSELVRSRAEPLRGGCRRVGRRCFEEETRCDTRGKARGAREPIDRASTRLCYSARPSARLRLCDSAPRSERLRLCDSAPRSERLRSWPMARRLQVSGGGPPPSARPLLRTRQREPGSCAETSDAANRAAEGPRRAWPSRAQVSQSR